VGISAATCNRPYHNALAAAASFKFGTIATPAPWKSTKHMQREPRSGGSSTQETCVASNLRRKATWHSKTLRATRLGRQALPLGSSREQAQPTAGGNKRRETRRKTRSQYSHVPSRARTQLRPGAHERNIPAKAAPPVDARADLAEASEVRILLH
jgi:hypothetical protein